MSLDGLEESWRTRTTCVLCERPLPTLPRTYVGRFLHWLNPRPPFCPPAWSDTCRAGWLRRLNLR